jgi:GGDEF domain-containing protein
MKIIEKLENEIIELKKEILKSKEESKKYRKMSITDSLTKIYNRRAFDEEILLRKNEEK